MKLGLSTDFGSPRHWARLVDFAQENGAERLTFWGDYSGNHFGLPCLYPSRPELVPEERRGAISRARDRMAKATEATTQAGMDFWYVYQVLQLPDAARARDAAPDLFNAEGEPDMAGDAIEELVRSQLDEVLEIAPQTRGIELWVMECAAITISHLKHQSLPLPEVFRRIVGTVHDHLGTSGRRLAVDLHTAGGDPVARKSLLAAATEFPDVLVSGDNVVGDFHLRLPFNGCLVEAGKTNPVVVHFDLNGEYWGRNFVPTAALDQYAEHLEQARALGAEYADGRVSTGHDRWSPHANILPSRVRHYPVGQGILASSPVPTELEVCSFDTLGGLNAEFFCRRAKDAEARADECARKFLVREFGRGAMPLADLFLRLQRTLAKIFFMGSNYFCAQSAPTREGLVRFWALDHYLTAEPGAEFPPTEVMGEACRGRAAFAAWPVPDGHRAPGAAALLEEKREAVTEAQEMLDELRELTRELGPSDRGFLIHQFETLVLYAESHRWLAEAMFLLYQGEACSDEATPVATGDLGECLARLEIVAGEWERRYDATWYGDPATTLRDWVKRGRGLLCPNGLSTQGPHG